MAGYFGLFAAPEQLKGRGSQDFSMPAFDASSLLDSPWLDAMLTPSACQQSQVVPDAIELDLAGLEQHIHAAAAAAADSASSPHSPQWSADLGDLLQQQQQPSSSAHALSSFDGADSLAATAALLGDSQQEAPLFSAAAFGEGPLPAAESFPTHQQQQVPEMPQWVPTATQQREQAAPAPATAGFVWPCPQELRCPALDTGTLAAVSAFAAVFPATPAAATTTSRPASAGLPHAHTTAMTPAADSAGSGTAPAVVQSKARAAAAKTRVSGSSRVHQLLGPAVRTRAEAVARYKAKRARRSSVSRVRYHRRKDYADQRPRVGGRFVKVKGVQQQPQQAQAQLVY